MPAKTADLHCHTSSPCCKSLALKTVGGVSNIWRLPLDGGEPRQLTAFATQRITSFAVSRDGKRLAPARGTTSSDVVLIRNLLPRSRPIPWPG